MRRLCGLLIVLICTLAPAAFAQLPLLDTLSRDPTDDQAYGELPWDSLDKTSFPPACSPGYCVMGFDTVSGMFDCGPCSSSAVATPTAPAATLTPTPTPTLEVCPLVDACVTATAPPSLTPTPQLTAYAAPTTCRTANTTLGPFGGFFKLNPAECLPTPDPTATVTSTAALVTPTYTVPFATPTPQLTAAAAPVACRTANTVLGPMGGLFKNNPGECLPTPDPTATVTSTAALVTPTYTIPFATPTPQLTAAAAPCTCRTVITADVIIGGMYADNPCACVPTPAPTATIAPAGVIVHVGSTGTITGTSRLFYDTSTGYACIATGTSATCTPDRVLTIVNDETSIANTASGQIALIRAARTGAGGSVGIVRKKSRGSVGAETPPQSGDGIGGDFWQAYCDDGAATCLGFLNGAAMTAAMTETVTSTTTLGMAVRVATTATSGGTALINSLAIHGGKVGVGPSVTTPSSARLGVQEETIGDIVQSLASTATNDDPNELTRQGRTQTTAAAAGTLVTLATATGQSYLIESRILGRCVSGAGCTAGDSQACVIYSLVRNVGGVVTEVSQTTDLATADASMSGTCSAAGDHAVSGTNYLIGVTGAANETVTWHATVKVHNLGS